ncbi:LLM class flavin-dependent oxidoreductase [Jatrophihabitans fulvus]
MRIGATLAHLADAPPFDVVPWARRLVEAGFESLWTPELVGRGALVPDPFVTLAAAAGATEGVELGTATVQVPLHHPAELAHRMLSLHAVCGDRLTFGASPGSTEVDYATLDRDYATRFPAFRRDVARVRALVRDGRDDDAVLARSGADVRFLLGSWGRNVERAAREFDGWVASGYRRTPDEIVEALGRFRAAGGGRAVVCTVPVERHDQLDSAAESLRRYADAGFDDAVVLFAPDGPEPEEVRPALGGPW